MKRKLKRCTFFLLILVLLAFALIGCGISEDVYNEVDIISEQIKNKLLDEYPDDNKETHMLEISDVSYSISKIKKSKIGFGNEIYKIICAWEVNVSDSYCTEENQRFFIYYDIENGYRSSELENGNGIAEVELTLSINGTTYTSASDKKQENHENHVQCKVCEKYFNKGSENAKSIRITNMCTRCYKNYKTASDFLNELPID